MECAWLESGVDQSLCFENREVNYPDFCLGFMHVFFLLTFMVLFINPSHQFRYDCTLACTHSCLLWLEGKFFLLSIVAVGCVRMAILEFCSGCTLGCMWAEGTFLPWVGELQWEGCSFIQSLEKELGVAVVALITQLSLIWQPFFVFPENTHCDCQASGNSWSLLWWRVARLWARGAGYFSCCFPAQPDWREAFQKLTLLKLW